MSENQYPAMNELWGRMAYSLEENVRKAIMPQEGVETLISIITRVLPSLVFSVSPFPNALLLYTERKLGEKLGENLEKSCADLLNSNDYILVRTETMEAIQEIAPFVPENEKGQFQEITATKKEESTKLLAMENARWLFGIIIPILFSLLLRCLPDKNAEESLRLQEESNEMKKCSKSFLNISRIRASL